MKTLGAVLIVSGLLVSLIGYGLYENISCHCPAQIGGSLGCHCMNGLPENMGHLLVYVGFTVAGGGIFIFMKWWRKKIIFN
jgi:hypothetical protein